MNFNHLFIFAFSLATLVPAKSTATSPTCIVSSQTYVTSALLLKECPKEKGVFARSLDYIAEVLHLSTAEAINISKRKNSQLDILKLISVSEVGRNVLREVLPKLRNGSLRFEILTPKNRKHYHLPDNFKAGFYSDGAAQNIIFFDENTELGSLSVMIYHEFLHSLDRPFIESEGKMKTLKANKAAAESKMKTTQDEKEISTLVSQYDDLSAEIVRLDDQRKFRGEKVAYAGQALYVNDVNRLFPCFRNYILEQSARREILLDPNEKTILQAYNLNPAYLQ